MKYRRTRKVTHETRGNFLKEIFLGLKTGEALALKEIAQAYQEKFYIDRDTATGNRLARLAISCLFDGNVGKWGWSRRYDGTILVKLASVVNEGAVSKKVVCETPDKTLTDEERQAQGWLTASGLERVRPNRGRLVTTKGESAEIIFTWMKAAEFIAKY